MMTRHYCRVLRPDWDSLKMPYYITHGNHDRIDEQSWKSIWNLPWHYSIEYKNAAFIFLNSADDKGTY